MDVPFGVGGSSSLSRPSKFCSEIHPKLEKPYDEILFIYFLVEIKFNFGTCPPNIKKVLIRLYN
jgi:hypothetical protein